MNNDNDVIEILDDIDNSDNVLPNLGAKPSNVSPAKVENNEVQEEYVELEKQLEEVKYDPIEPEKQEIKIETEEADNSKSGLSFVIILFFLLAIFIIALPYISKLI